MRARTHRFTLHLVIYSRRRELMRSLFKISQSVTCYSWNFGFREHTITAILLQAPRAFRSTLIIQKDSSHPSVPPQCSADSPNQFACTWPDPNTFDSIANLHNMGEKYRSESNALGVCLLSTVIKIIGLRNIPAYIYGPLFVDVLFVLFHPETVPPKSIPNASRTSFSSVRTLITYTHEPADGNAGRIKLVK